MKFYTGILFHAGHHQHQIQLRRVSAPEIILLGRMHGSDSIKNLKEVADVEPFNDFAERERLNRKFGFKPEHRQYMQELFGPVQSPLPKEAILTTGESQFDLEALAAEEQARIDAAAAAAEQAPQEEAVPTQEPPKRRPGRPRKNPQPEEVSHGEGDAT